MTLNFKGKISKMSAILLIVAAILTGIAAFTSLWRIDIAAPQYPEGMVMYIGGLKGVDGGEDGIDLEKINELNHYVGMDQIHPGDFWEFSVLPYVLLAFAVFFIVAAIARKKGVSIAALIAFGIFGVLGFIDFYHWTYVYGHNLDPTAPIKVPGMAYQPPIIGVKQLLNMTVMSQPDLGGYLLVVSGLLVAFVVFKEVGVFAGKKKAQRMGKAIHLIAFSALLLAACSVNDKPQAINAGEDQCEKCGMTIEKKQFSCEYISDKGKCFKFDDATCLFHYLHDNNIGDSAIAKIYVADYNQPDSLIDIQRASLVLGEFQTPMNGGVAAFKVAAQASKFAKDNNAILLDSWKRLKLTH